MNINKSHRNESPIGALHMNESPSDELHKKNCNTSSGLACIDVPETKKTERDIIYFTCPNCNKPTKALDYFINQ
jgi:hypothetical protein